MKILHLFSDELLIADQFSANMEQDKMNNTMAMFCISSPMPVKLLSSLKKAKLPEVGLGEKYQAELPTLLSNKVSSGV